MATVTTTVLVSYEDNAGQVTTMGVSQRQRVVATDKVSLLTQTISFTVDTALNLGDISSPSEVFVKNMDLTNYVEIKDDASGVMVRLRPDTDGDGKGGCCLLSELGAAIQTPTARANVAACEIQIMVVSI